LRLLINFIDYLRRPPPEPDELPEPELLLPPPEEELPPEWEGETLIEGLPEGLEKLPDGFDSDD